MIQENGSLDWLRLSKHQSSYKNISDKNRIQCENNIHLPLIQWCFHVTGGVSNIEKVTPRVARGTNQEVELMRYSFTRQRTNEKKSIFKWNAVYKTHMFDVKYASDRYDSDKHTQQAYRGEDRTTPGTSEEGRYPAMIQ